MSIDNWTEHAIAMGCIEQLMGDNIQPDTEDGDGFIALAIAVEKFEDENLSFGRTERA